MPGLFLAPYPDVRYGTLDTAAFLFASNGLVTRLRLLGEGFQLIANDIENNIHGVEECYNLSKHASIRDLLSKDPTSRDPLLWLTRSLIFVYQFIESIVKDKEKREDLSEFVQQAYDVSLKDWHRFGFAANIGVYLDAKGRCPSRTDLISKLSSGLEESDLMMKKTHDWLRNFRSNLEVITRLNNPISFRYECHNPNFNWQWQSERIQDG